MSKLFFTVKNYDPSDLVGAISSLEGTDDAGVNWAFVKFSADTPLPAWVGTPYPLSKEEAVVASQSALYDPSPNAAPGELYRIASKVFGDEMVESFVSQASGFPSITSDRALTRLNLAALAGIEGFVSLLRYQVATTPTRDDVTATDFNGWTSAAQGALLAQLDAWLCKFPSKASPTPAGTDPQMALLTTNALPTDPKITLLPGQAYLYSASAPAGETFYLPAWAGQNRRIRTPLVIENLSGFDITIQVNPGDTGVTYAYAGTTLTLAAGERGTFVTAQDGANKKWIERTA